jgi:ABC-2 type transport system permease protein
VRAYFLLFLQSARASFAYRQSVWGSLFSAGISYAVPVLVWRAVYAANPAAPALSAGVLFPYLLLAGCLNYAIAMNVEHRVGQRIRSGLIATDLLKPVDFQLAQLSQAFSDGLFNVTLCAPILAVTYLTLGRAALPADAVAFLSFLPSLFLAFAIMFSISFIFVQAAFFTYSGYGIFAARTAMQQTFSGVSAPLSLFPIWLQHTSEWLPFRHTVHTPLSIYLGWVQGPELWRALGAQLGWAVLLFLAGRAILAFSLRRLEIQGG